MSGGNIDVTILSRVIDRGLQKAGRLAELEIELEDRPGQLKGVSRIISDLGGNVVSVSHDRADVHLDINSCVLRISMETRDMEHLNEIRKTLADHNYTIK